MQQHKPILLNINEIDDLISLKAQGTYLSLKTAIESHIGFKLGVKGWQSLLSKILVIKNGLKCGSDYFETLIAKETLSASRKKIKEMLGIDIKATSTSQLHERFTLLVALFKAEVFDPYEKYERNKRKNFVNSSRLEGIELPTDSPTVSRQDLISKYSVN
jgi:hypothetical protein